MDGIPPPGSPCCRHCTRPSTSTPSPNTAPASLRQPRSPTLWPTRPPSTPNSPCALCRLLASIRPAPGNTTSPADDGELEIAVESAGFHGSSPDDSGAVLSSGERPVNPTILWLGNVRKQADLGYLRHDGPGFVASLTQGRQVPGISPRLRFRSATAIDFGLLRGWLRECQELHADFCGWVYK
ncbi:hypothetical protein B0H67DRAFT_640240 [Lasiosphaeris hirsuta]|uniref:Uncharacterized protein n=1 Tax=Lasiosphaeris hirsuta TaxID=260670 RepID=A0AA40BCX7_9PEZI|nr:hypothetical protein B0H67DRAFT_640240 [Lasiosphaeris hirsuta]